MPSYHFDVGDSSTGPIGFCARVTAASKATALARLREELPQEVEVRRGIEGESIEYILVYLNGEAVTIDDIDEVLLTLDEPVEPVDGANDFLTQLHGLLNDKDGQRLLNAERAETVDGDEIRVHAHGESFIVKVIREEGA